MKIYVCFYACLECKSLNIYRCKQSIKYMMCRNLNALYYFVTLYNNSISSTSCKKINKIGGHDRIMQLCLRLNLWNYMYSYSFQPIIH